MNPLKIIIGTILVLIIVGLLMSPAIMLSYNLIYDSYEQRIYGHSTWRLLLVYGAWYLIAYPIVVAIIGKIVCLPDGSGPYLFLSVAISWSMLYLIQVIFTKAAFSFKEPLVEQLPLYIMTWLSFQVNGSDSG